MAITFSQKQKITSAIYEEFKKQRGDKPRDEYYDCEYALFLENKIALLMCEGKPKTTKRNGFHKHDVGKSFYCQREIEDKEPCDIQCDHCKEYYKPLEGQ